MDIKQSNFWHDCIKPLPKFMAPGSAVLVLGRITNDYIEIKKCISPLKSSLLLHGI